jgi:hypothetical protein
MKHHTHDDAVFLASVVGLAVASAGWLYFILSTFTTLHKSWSSAQFAVAFCALPPAIGLVSGWITLYFSNRRFRRTLRKVQDWQS